MREKPPLPSARRPENGKKLYERVSGRNKITDETWAGRNEQQGEESEHSTQG
ncbi:hypothetical protein FHR84_000749 [Actinopolyspora biskrensis]|uniref:Uncharacterized protein n=1 Tax=Actinopolyspora biskrensis TaxID=1470178 RepID=A0A852YWZ0_9ACTN|nr:hypothetical protein [Actinopolyspora biskrensis]NYH77435.1 hypothetical protein [Actinopolyspora biskrensis]